MKRHASVLLAIVLASVLCLTGTAYAGATWLAPSLLNTNGVDELAVLVHHRTTDKPYVLIRDASTGAIVNNIAYSPTFLPW